MSVVFVYAQLNVKTVLVQAIQFSISTQFSSIWPTDRTLWGASTPGQSRPENDDNKRVLCIPQSSPSDRLVSYLGHSFGEGAVLPLCRKTVGVIYSPSRMGLCMCYWALDNPQGLICPQNKPTQLKTEIGKYKDREMPK